MSKSNPADPLEMIKALWGQMPTPLPGFVVPSVDADELEKRITDLKAVEGWLKTNLSMLQTTIHGLEVQRSTLQALKSMAAQASDAANSGAGESAAWPWSLLQQAGAAWAQTAETKASDTADAPTRKPRSRRKP